MDDLLTIEHLSIGFAQYKKGLDKHVLYTISDLAVSVKRGEIVAIVGSSGSGKSLLAHAIIGILPSNAILKGDISFKGQRLEQHDKERIRGREIALVPQSVNYLDPLLAAGRQILPPKGVPINSEIEGSLGTTEERDRLAASLLLRYGLSPEVAKSYPHQLSGGMARKVILQTALATGCELIIADEPTPGLDEPALNEVLADFKNAAGAGRGILMITHDINAALKIADRIAIFYAGTTFEVADVRDFNGDGDALRHPYTRALLHALPDRGFTPIPGSQPYPGDITEGCLFRDRCSRCSGECGHGDIPLREYQGGMVRCLRPEK